MTFELRALAATPPLPLPWLAAGSGDLAVYPVVPVERLTDPIWVADRITMAAAASPGTRDPRIAGLRTSAGAMCAVLSRPMGTAARTVRQWLEERSGSPDPCAGDQ